MKYRFIKNHEYLFPIEKMCKVLEVGSSGYYKWKSKPISNRTFVKEEIKQKITSIYFASKQRYGSPRITTELNALGYKISRITVAKYMRELGLRSKLSKKFKVTTDSKHNFLVVENVLDRNFTVANPSRVWVSDITYIQTKEGFLYLTTIIDLYDRKVIGWSLGNSMNTDQTTLAAWKMAIRNRSIQNGLIFHSDRGFNMPTKCLLIQLNLMELSEV
jgi:putative transposase